MRARIIGVHTVEADEPVHLVELQLEGDLNAFNMESITQEVADQPKMNWQALYDERVLEQFKSMVRYAFFFHHLDFDKPLLVGTDALQVPAPTTLPAHLQDIEYESP